MDPLSISASVASLLSFSNACAQNLRKVIHTVRNAPVEIIALTNELADLNILLADVTTTTQAIERAPSRDQADRDFLSAFSVHLLKARSKLTDLHSLASTLSTSTSNGGIKFQRYVWLRRKSTAIQVQRELAEIRQSLSLLFASNTASRTLKIELSLHGISTDPILPIGERVEAEADVTQPADQSPTAISGRLSPAGSHGENPDINISVQNGTPSDRDTVQLSSPQQGNIQPELSTLLQTVRQIAQFSSFTFHVHRLARCDGDCQCICHFHGRFQSPQLLNKFFGALFVGYAGLPIMTSQCDLKTCTNQYSRTVHVSYTFPGWFLSRTIDLVAATTYTGEPSFGVKVRNRINHSGENSIFKYARDGNVQGIIEMFKQRKASPNDLSLGGHSVLHFPLELGHIETCKFLLDLGVDPYFEDDNGLSPARVVSSYILSSRNKTELAKAYESTFFGISSSHSELWDFSYIHRVIVGIQPTELSRALQEPVHRLAINKLDTAGRSPLFWAALRGDDMAVKTLLQAGVDFNSQDYEGRTALHAAIQAGSLRSVELLLMAGASVHTRDKYGDTAIQIATWCHTPCLPDSNVPILEALYLAGAAVNARQYKGNSAIQSAACLNRVANGTYLLSIGADPNNRDHAGDMPIFECIFYNTHGMLDLLLKYPETKLDNVNNAGQTILHFSALYADERSMEILTLSRICGMRLDARDKQGRTARMAFEGRTFMPNEQLHRAFDALLEKAGRAADGNGEANMTVQIHDGDLRRVSTASTGDTNGVFNSANGLRTENGHVHVSGDEEAEEENFVDALESLTFG